MVYKATENYNIFELGHSLIKYHYAILKFNLYILKYKFPNSNFVYASTYTTFNAINLTRCIDYEKYRKVYRLIYGI